MEHLKDPYLVLLQMAANLKQNATYRFFCPNYDFPYEPHFGKWLYRRQERAFYLQRSQASSKIIAEKDAQGLYSSLNFITLKKIKRSLVGTNICLSANHNSLYEIIKRAIQDSELKKRHKRLTNLMKIFFILKLHHFAKMLPVNYQPIMDVKVTLSAKIG
jgi:hypothetical protein